MREGIYCKFVSSQKLYTPITLSRRNENPITEKYIPLGLTIEFLEAELRQVRRWIKDLKVDCFLWIKSSPCFMFVPNMLNTVGALAGEEPRIS